MITDTLREALRDSGMTQQQIATAAGVSQRAISDFLRGRALYSDALDRLGEAMGAKISVPKSFRKNIQNRIDVA